MSLKNLLLLAFGCALFFTSCVSKKIFKGEQVRYVQLQAQYDKLQEDLKNCNDLTVENGRKKAVLETELESLRSCLKMN